MSHAYADDEYPDDRYASYAQSAAARWTRRLGAPSPLALDWHQTDRAATLPEHSARFGLLPRLARSGGNDLLSQVAAAALTGRGGAGFPTATKMRAVAAGRGPAVVVANGTESETASEKDQALLAGAPHLVLDGKMVAAEAVGAAAAHLCLPGTRDWLVDSGLAAVAERQYAGVDRIAVTVHELPHHYVRGRGSLAGPPGGQCVPGTRAPAGEGPAHVSH